MICKVLFRTSHNQLLHLWKRVSDIKNKKCKLIPKLNGTRDLKMRGRCISDFCYGLEIALLFSHSELVKILYWQFLHYQVNMKDLSSGEMVLRQTVRHF